MSDAPKIEPSKITRPIQLLAAWLAGLVLVDTLYLAAAANIHQPAWGASVLVIATVLNTPIFLASLFLLQTRFRPEMQEDQFYYRYLEQRFSKQTMSTELVEVTQPRIASDSRKSLPDSSIQAPPLRSRPLPGSATSQTAIKLVTGLKLNHNMSVYSAVRDDLLDKGLVAEGTFGSSDGRSPKNFIISCGEGAPVETIRLAVEFASRHGASGIARSRDETIAGEVLVGAYSYDRVVQGKERYTHLSEALVKQLVRKDLTFKNFEMLVREAE